MNQCIDGVSVGLAMVVSSSGFLSLWKVKDLSQIGMHTMVSLPYLSSGMLHRLQL